MPKQVKPPKYWIPKIVGAYVATENCQSKIEAVIQEIQDDACKPKSECENQNGGVSASNDLLDISERLKNQDNRITQHPMFCVQEKKRDTGFDTSYCDDKCWWNAHELECVFEEPDDLEGWEEFGYKDRWETVMVAFTEGGCKEYINLNGHNHRGELRIYAESFRRCPEMIAIREALMSNAGTHLTGT